MERIPWASKDSSKGLIGAPYASLIEEKISEKVPYRNNVISIGHLSKVKDWGAEVLRPAVLTLGADVPGVPVAVHDGLEDGGERGDPDPGSDEDCVLGPENLARGGSEGPVDVDLFRNRAKSYINH